MWGCGGDSAVQPHSMAGVGGGRGRDTHTHTGIHTGIHTGTYTRMLHLPFSDLPLKKCPNEIAEPLRYLAIRRLSCCASWDTCRAPPKRPLNMLQSGGFPRGRCRQGRSEIPFFAVNSRFSATEMTGRPGHRSEPGVTEYNILFLGSIVVISSQDSSALGYRGFTQEGAPICSQRRNKRTTMAKRKKMLLSPRSVQ